jgi:hypothetical protein
MGFGDNASVFISSTVPLSTLNKQHNALSCLIIMFVKVLLLRSYILSMYTKSSWLGQFLAISTTTVILERGDYY